jgi:hypothetical protein
VTQDPSHRLGGIVKWGTAYLAPPVDIVTSKVRTYVQCVKIYICTFYVHVSVCESVYDAQHLTNISKCSVFMYICIYSDNCKRLFYDGFLTVL